MIKLIVFDLDGVLVSTREIHYQALNKALEIIDNKYIINKEEHILTYDGLPTRKKLELLTINKGLPINKYNEIWKLKQEFTWELIENTLNIDDKKIILLKKLKELGYKIYVASNSIKISMIRMLEKSGLLPYIDYTIANDDVVNPKPHPEIYIRCMLISHFKPKEILIIEDSTIGREAAIESGAHLCGVENPQDTTLDKILNRIKEIDKPKLTNLKWMDKNMNVLIPMAGRGSRFEQAGHTFPKPLIDIKGKPMIQIVAENLKIDANFIYIVQKEHYNKYNLKYLLELITPGCKIVQVDGITEGAACTTLLAKDFINNNDHLLYANSDQFVEWDSSDFIFNMTSKQVDAGILTFESTHPKWSYVKLNELGYVTEVAEKKPISNIATVGLYYWKHGSDYVKYAEQMINKNIRVNSEFYVCPVFNEAILDDKKIKTYNVDKMWGLGDPESLEYFIDNYKGVL